MQLNDELQAGAHRVGHYEHLLPDVVELDVFGCKVLCISLDQLIAVKKELGRPRDVAAVLELEALKKLSSEV